MSDQQKIWFVYITDHHEGPFTPAEVAEKVTQGQVTAQTLGWKDGMAEWVPIDSIPELQAAINAASAPAAADPAAAGGEGEGFSLAQMLAAQQGGGEAPAADFTSGADALAAIPSGVNEHGAPAAAANYDSGMPGPDEEVWTLRVGAQVNGLYSLNQLKSMAAAGDVPPTSMLWHAGWTDFQPLASVPELASVRAAKRSGNTVGSGVMKRPAGLAPITAAANVGDDDDTDTNIGAPSDEPGSRGLKGVLAKVAGIFKRKPKELKPDAGKPSFTKGKGKVTPKGGLVAKIKRVAAISFLLLLVAGGGAAYFLFLASPLPRDLDVIPEDLEQMTETVKAPETEGGRLYLAPARGTEEVPADDTSPKFYVATNLAEGTAVTMQITGKPGSLVNRTSFTKQYFANVGANKLAVFERLDDDGKPLPMGEYSVKVTAGGATPLSFDRFMGGRKSAAYQDRLKKYKDKLQGDYDKEMQELREMIDTLKGIHSDMAKRLADYKVVGTVAANRPRLQADWRGFGPTSLGILTQLDQKLKGRNASGASTFHPRAFQDVATTLAQLQQLLQAHGQRVEGQLPAANPDELDASVQAGITSLEQLLAQLLVKSPFDLPAASDASK